jgi:hypothetical protein
MSYTRRRLLAVAGAAAAVSAAGCLGGNGGDGGSGGTGGGGTADGLPLGDGSPPGSRGLAAYRDATVDVLRKDGIPAIDEPRFDAASDADLADDEPVFGVARGDTVKAYPRAILAWHEIVNDRVDGDPVAVTYCPLTGTVLGFRRGATSFGVSGDLVNSNLIMYDRATDSRWPQMLGAAVQGPHEGDVLQEIPVVWTTWRRWREVHPDTRVLSEDTGAIRDYDRDPYGSYAPVGGYYGNRNLLFDTMPRDESRHPKDVYVAARDGDGAAAFGKETLRDDRVATAGGFTAVYDAALDVGRVYRNPDGVAVTAEGEGYRVGAEDGDGGDGAGADGSPSDVHAADALPLEAVPGFDAMWFAWSAFFPETAVHG